MRLLKSFLSRFIRNGTLELVGAGGERHRFGGEGPGPDVEMHVHDPKLHLRLATNPELALPEGYMDGGVTFERGTHHDFLELFSVNRRTLLAGPLQRRLHGFTVAARRFQQNNTLGLAAKRVQHHYDLSGDLYRLFLDEGLNYSCAYWRDPDTETLEQAQENKLRLIAAKLDLKPGMTVAEIGSGWGSLAMTLARAGAHVTGVNVSKEQLAVSRARVEAAGLSDRVTFIEQDYRELEGQFDRVVSVGMLEHVGVFHYDEYFRKVRSLLKDDGYALIHAIGKISPPGATSPFLHKYIFPGGYSPALSEVFAAVERAMLWCGDCETLRLHYYYTIREWRRRFADNREAAVELYDERFARMWEFYLSAVELGFLHGSNFVFQLLLAKEREAVPIRRDFILDNERELLR